MIPELINALRIVAAHMEAQSPLDFEGMYPWDWCRAEAEDLEVKARIEGLIL